MATRDGMAAMALMTTNRPRQRQLFTALASRGSAVENFVTTPTVRAEFVPWARDGQAVELFVVFHFAARAQSADRRGRRRRAVTQPTAIAR
jgi:hypothetical protein